MSTIGSVAGVFVTAFGLIPYVTNFAALLIVALCLALLSLAAALRCLPRRSPAGPVGVAAAIAALSPCCSSGMPMPIRDVRDRSLTAACAGASKRATARFSAR